MLMSSISSTLEVCQAFVCSIMLIDKLTPHVILYNSQIVLPSDEILHE